MPKLPWWVIQKGIEENVYAVIDMWPVTRGLCFMGEPKEHSTYKCH